MADDVLEERFWKLPKAVTYSDDTLAEQLEVEQVFLRRANIHPPEDRIT